MPLPTTGSVSADRKPWVFGLLALCLMLGLSDAGRAQSDYGYIDISNPFIRKIPLAVPAFKAIQPEDAQRAQALAAADMLAQTIDFSGYFKLLDRSMFLADPNNPNIVVPDISFSNWTGIGAEMLITGSFWKQDNTIEMELRLYDTFKERLLVGKRYKGFAGDERQMIRRFCSEVVFYLTGNRGIYESRIAFVSTGSGHKEIYTCDFDGFNPVPFTKGRDMSLFPAWSTTGKWLAYTSYVKGKPDLYIRSVKERRGAIVSKPGINSTPAWVPGRFELAATLSFTGDPEIYLLTGKGEIIKRLTHKRGIDSSPAWSPDGKQMAFVSKRAGTPQIYIMNIASREITRLTFQGRYNTQPAWSPRGDQIAYTAMENGQIDVRVINVDGSGLRQLTHGEGDNESPTWSPDGSLIAFSTTREGPSRIYVMTSYGTDQRRLLTLPGQQSTPSWSMAIAAP